MLVIFFKETFSDSLLTSCLLCRTLQESLSQTVSFSVEAAVEYARTMATKFQASSCAHLGNTTDIFMQDMSQSSWELMSLYTAHFLSGLLKLSTPSPTSSEKEGEGQTYPASTSGPSCSVPFMSHGTSVKLEVGVDQSDSIDDTNRLNSTPVRADVGGVCMNPVSFDELAERQGASRWKHDLRPRKDVPPIALYTFRGVMCKICFQRFNGKSCVETLIEHTKLHHKELATERYLKYIRLANRFERLIGNGIPYCTCDFCRRFGLASLKDS